MGFQGILTDQTRNCDVYDRLCSETEILFPDNNAGASCEGGTFDQQDSNLGVTEESCQDGGGEFQPYSCQDVNSYLEFFSEEPDLDEVINNWWRPKCCGVMSDNMKNRICSGTEIFLPDNNAGATCEGGTLDQQDSNSGVTEESCQDGGGELEPYSCEELNWFLNNDAEESGLDEEAISFLVNSWWKP